MADKAKANPSLHEKMFTIQGVSVKKDAKNPFFKSSYMSLDNILKVLNPLLQKQRLLVYHYTGFKCIEGNEKSEPVLYTRVNDIDSSDYIESTFLLTGVGDPQKVGSCITYAKRYNLGELFNIVTDVDDDGNAASVKTPPAKTKIDYRIKLGQFLKDKGCDNEEACVEYIRQKTMQDVDLSKLKQSGAQVLLSQLIKTT